MSVECVLVEWFVDDGVRGCDVPNPWYEQDSSKRTRLSHPTPHTQVFESHYTAVVNIQSTIKSILLVQYYYTGLSNLYPLDTISIVPTPSHFHHATSKTWGKPEHEATCYIIIQPAHLPIDIATATRGASPMFLRMCWMISVRSLISPPQ